MKYLLMLATLLAVGGVGTYATPANAQTSVAVDINKATLNWDWAIGTGGVADTFTMKCGATETTLTTITPLAVPTLRSIPVKSVISGPGNWTCVITASNQYGESLPSNSVVFFAGTSPVAPTNLHLIAQ